MRAAVATAAAALIFLTGCTGGSSPTLPDEPDKPGDNTTADPVGPGDADTQWPLTFAMMSDDEKPQSRAFPLNDYYADFGVIGWKSVPGNPKMMVMSHNAVTDPKDADPYHVKWDTDRWTYAFTSFGTEQYERFWDFSASQYTFAAFAPYTIGGNKATDSYNVAFDSEGHVSISAIEGNVALTPESDWVVALHRRVGGDSPKDIDLLTGTETAASSLSATVPLAFHHLLSVVEFRAYAEKSKQTDDINVTRLAVQFVVENEATGEVTPVGGIHRLADYTQSGDDITLSQFSYLPYARVNIPPTSGDYTLEPISSTDDYREKAILIGDQTLQLPQSFSSQRLRITVTTANTTVARIFDFNDSWEPGKRYIYYLNISENAQIIIMDVDVKKYDWTAGNDLDIGDVTNW